jgi:hypothetical protein
MPVLGLESMFLHDRMLSAVVVVAPGSDPVCITRGRFFAELTGPMGFGRSIYARRQLRAMPPPQTMALAAGVFIRDMEIVLERLAELKRMGIRLALDDFGAGFSSLGYLSRMPIDVLKLDRAFVAQLGNADERGLLAGVVALAQSLELPTVAEGVETEAQLRELQAAGCTFAQGFFFSAPMDALMLGRSALRIRKDVDLMTGGGDLRDHGLRVAGAARLEQQLDPGLGDVQVDALAHM